MSGCSVLAGIVGGTGPVYTNTSGTYTAEYTCYSGYTMIGSASLTCSVSNTWSTNPPECINDKYYNNLNISDSGVPLWLAILLGIVAGVAILLLLCCLLMCCLRLCGCLPGSFFGGASHYDANSGCCYCCKKRGTSPQRRHGQGSRGRGYDSRRSSLIDIENGPYIVANDQNRYRHNKVRPQQGENYHKGAIITNGRPPVNHENQHQYNLVRSNIIHTETDTGFSKQSGVSPRYMAYADKNVNNFNDVNELNRKEAKELKQWMPHSNPVRNINTSTK